MKKRILTIIGALTMMVMVSFGQLVDEKNVTLTMELQPVLQLNLQGSDQIDFVFDDIYDYVGGITKYGATVLKVSSSVSFDLWATGLSTTADFLWDNPIEYGTVAGTAVDEIPTTAVELHQFPPNPTVTAAPTCGVVAITNTSDYSAGFTPATFSAPFGAPTIVLPILVTANNTLYTTPNTTPYLAPADGALAINAEKYIAGGSGLVAGCQVTGGTYLAVSGVPTIANAGYYFTLDYRILPGLPAVFPASNASATDAAQVANAIAAAESTGQADAVTSLGDVGTNFDYAAPGVYTMYVKYILVQDQ